MRFFNKALFCVIAILFVFPGRLEPQETKPKAKREGPVYRSIFLGIDLRVEITSAVFIRENPDDSKTYLYSYLIQNGGGKTVKLGFPNFSGCPGSSSEVCEFELEAGKGTLATFESKAGPKTVPISQAVKISDGEGKWTTEGFNFSFIYVPDLSSREKKDGSPEKNKNTVLTAVVFLFPVLKDRACL